ANVAGLLATTFDIADQDFLDGNFNFVQNSASTATIKNEGTITLGGNGFVYLIAPNVDNSGHVIANIGKVTMASNGEFSIDLSGNGLIKFSVDPSVVGQVAGQVANSGSINGQHVVLSGGTADSVMSSVVNQGNITAASSLRMSGSALITSPHPVTQVASTITATHADVEIEVFDEGATIGEEGNALRLDAGTLTAKTNKGHIVVTDTGGGVALNEIDTGSRSIDDGLRAIVKSEGGAISSTGGPATNITAWATNLESDTSIGSASDAITTNVDVLNASTQNGGIFVQNQQGDLIVGTVSARETVTVSGMPT